MTTSAPRGGGGGGSNKREPPDTEQMAADDDYNCVSDNGMAWLNWAYSRKANERHVWLSFSAPACAEAYVMRVLKMQTSVSYLSITGLLMAYVYASITELSMKPEIISKLIATNQTTHLLALRVSVT